jgi:hypothetical protein
MLEYQPTLKSSASVNWIQTILNRRQLYLNCAHVQHPPMSTPAMMLASMLKLMIICLTTFWIVSFSMGRFFVFYEAYTSALRIIRDEAWIRTQCADPQFYSNLKQHSDLCQSVQINFERSPLLVALNAVSETAHLCGRYSCTDNLIAISRGGWPVMLSVGFISLVAPTLLYQVMRSLMSARCVNELPINYHAGKFL